jgi:hypothetical protein
MSFYTVEILFHKFSFLQALTMISMIFDIFDKVLTQQKVIKIGS